MERIRIGTRDSRLALWQANTVEAMLAEIGFEGELVPVKSEGDLDLVTPIYAMGVEGVFTKTLDAYLLSNKIDIAVHSMKDVPTQMAEGLHQAAVLERASYKDILVCNKNKPATETYSKIGTGSVRRQALWLNRYPDCQIESLRGNVQTRLNKLANSDWDGAIFAEAGLARVNLLPQHYQTLDWMLPAPAQGAIMIACRKNDMEKTAICRALNHAPTAICVKIERDFLRTLMGGCSTPISALAIIVKNQIVFKGSICSLDGQNLMEIEKVFNMNEADKAGVLAATELLAQGAGKIVESIRGKM